jgi:hypothetical protein
MRLIVDEGYHPQLGARALKRAIEKYLVQPIGARLAALPPAAPIVVHLTIDNKKIAVNIEEIKLTATKKSVWQTHDFTNVDNELDSIEDALDRFENEIAMFKPNGEADFKNEHQARYFLIREHIKRIERMIERAEKWFKREKLTDKSEQKRSSNRSRSERQLVTLKHANINSREVLHAPNVTFKLKELAVENRIFGEQLEDYLQDIWRETALLQILIQNLEHPQIEHCELKIRANDENSLLFATNLLKLYKNLFENEIGLKTSEIKIHDEISTLVVDGFYAADFVKFETGKHLIVSVRDGFVPLDIEVETTNASYVSDKNMPVIRIYDGHDENFRRVLDVRSELLASDALSVRELRAFVLSGLPAPKELS